MTNADNFAGLRAAVLLPTARTLPALALLVTSAASRSCLVVVVSLTSGTMTRWRTGLSMASPTLPLVVTWTLTATSPRLSGRDQPRLDVPPSSALLALSSPCPLGTPSATTVPQVSLTLKPSCCTRYVRMLTHMFPGNFGGEYGDNVLEPLGQAPVTV